MRRADSNQKVASARPTPATASLASIPAATVTLTNPTRRIGMTTTASPSRCAGNLHAPSCPAAAQQDHRRLPLLSNRIPPAYRAHSQKYIGIGQRIAAARSHQKVASARSTAATAGHASIPAATVTRASSSNPSLKCPQLAINTAMKTSDPGTLLTEVKLSTGDIIACPSAMRSYTATPHKYLHRTAPLLHRTTLLLHRTTPLLHRTAPLLQLPHGGCAAVRAAIELRTGCPEPPAGSAVVHIRQGGGPTPRRKHQDTPFS